MKALMRNHLPTLLMLTLIAVMAFFPAVAAAETVNVGDLVIDDQGVRGPGLYVGEEGVYLPGISVGEQGVHLPGIDVDEHGVRVAGLHFGDRSYGNGWFMSGSPFRYTPGTWPLFYFSPLTRLLGWAALFALAAAAVALMPRKAHRMADEIQAQPLRAGLIGLAIMVATPFALVLLLVTIIGIPAIPFVVAALAVGKFLGYVGVSLWLGQVLLRAMRGQEDTHNVYLYLLAGTGAIALVGMVPGVGWLVALAGAMLGLGAVWAALFTKRPAAPEVVSA